MKRNPFQYDIICDMSQRPLTWILIISFENQLLFNKNKIKLSVTQTHEL